MSGTTAGLRVTPQRRARRSHTKSKNGCRTCRQRKVKCDERRPLCQNCERHFIGLTECDFDDYVLLEPRTVTFEAVGAVNLQPVNETILAEPQAASQWRGRQAEPLRIQINLRQQILSPLLDPFQTHPATRLTPRTLDVLTRHYLGNFVYRTFPFYVRPAFALPWWHFLRDDVLAFNNTLLLSCFDLLNLRKTSRYSDDTDTESFSLSPDTVLHELMQHCLSLLALRAKDVLASTTDHTISSIAGMLALEYGRQNMKAVRAHRQGLHQLVQLRGGSKVFRQQNTMVANTVLWALMITNERSSPTSQGDMLHSRETLLQEYQFSTFGIQTSPEALLEMRVAGIDEETITCLGAVQLISETFATRDSNPELQQEASTLDALCVVVAELLDLGVNAVIDSHVSALSRAFRIAACLQVLAPVSAYFPDPTLLLHALVHDLKASLLQIVDKMEGMAHLFLWPLAVGGVSAHAMAERPWFVGHLVDVNNTLKIQNWNFFRQHIERFSQNDGFCTVSFNALWEDVNQKSIELMSLS